MNKASLEMAPMCACWHLFTRQYRELLCVLAGFSRVEYLNLIDCAWEHIAEPKRDKIMGVIRQQVAA